MCWHIVAVGGMLAWLVTVVLIATAWFGYDDKSFLSIGPGNALSIVIHIYSVEVLECILKHTCDDIQLLSYKKAINAVLWIQISNVIIQSKLLSVMRDTADGDYTVIVMTIGTLSFVVQLISMWHGMILTLHMNGISNV